MAEAKKGVTRREFLKVGGAGMTGLVGLSGLRSLTRPEAAYAAPPQQQDDEQSTDNHGRPGTVGTVDHEANGFHPMEILYDFDYGEVKEEDGRTVREWQMVAMDKEFEIAPGIFFPGWLYGSATSAASRRAGKMVGQCPGPTLRCVEGDLLRIHFTNASSHPHTIHG
jgi:FtsP/CotA-like multicopper oxidase with cupredoxin domain